MLSYARCPFTLVIVSVLRQCHLQTCISVLAHLLPLSTYSTHIHRLGDLEPTFSH